MNPTPRNDRPWVIMLAAFGLALLVRLAYLAAFRGSPYFEGLMVDAAWHHDWAQAWANGTWAMDGAFFRAPLYPWFLGICFRIFGENFFTPRLIQASFGTLTTALCYLLGRDAFDRRTGLLAALLVATSPILVYFDGELLIPTLAIPLNLAALWLTLRCAREGTSGGAVLAGVAWGTSRDRQAERSPLHALSCPVVLAREKAHAEESPRLRDDIHNWRYDADPSRNDV